MRRAVISDIHGNAEALLSVLKDIDKCHIDEIISLGDNIGYGPEPDIVVKSLHARAIKSVKGNHEMAAIEDSFLKWFNPNARLALLKTLELLTIEAFALIRDYPLLIAEEKAYFVHGFPPKSVSIYLFQTTEKALKKAFQSFSAPLSFVGHTHCLELVELSADQIRRTSLEKGILPLDPFSRYIINVGSVGQPRDHDNRAKYVIWDSWENTLEIRFVTYDVEQTIAKILSTGMPSIYADRLC